MSISEHPQQIGNGRYARFTRGHRARIKAVAKWLLTPRLPNRISRNFRTIDTLGREEVASSLKRHYFSRPVAGGSLFGEAYLSTAEGKQDFIDHLSRRLENFRQTVIPWLDHATPLMGSTILEIGCGTGSATVALAEQGASVTAVDLDEESIQVARDRCRAHGLAPDFKQANATEVHQLFRSKHFDLIIFVATLEHLLHGERISAMRSTWNMLPKGSLWCVVDTPNRLWYFDTHTSKLPFCFWLPDDLAFLYARFSPKWQAGAGERELTGDAMLNFLRLGRGVSFHEFDLAMRNAEELDVLSSLPIWLRKRNPAWAVRWRLTLGGRYETFLAEVGPKIHRGFYQSTLGLILRKD